MPKESILLLGGSQQQLIAIETAKRLGYRTVLCDYLPNNPGQYKADAFYQASTTDIEATLHVAEQESVNGVLAYSSDPAALTAAIVAEKMGLPSNSVETVDVLSNKQRFRECLQSCGLPHPKTKAFPADISTKDILATIESLGDKVVIKPTDSSGSKGVAVLDGPNATSVSQARDEARVYSRNGILIAEQFIEAAFPRVIGGDIYVVDGQIAFWGLMSCLRDDTLGGLVPVGERYPSGMSSAQEGRVKQALQQLVTSLGIRFGELNVEVIIGKDDTPFVLELGARAGGNMIPVQLSDISGIDLIEANVRSAMGALVQPPYFDGNDSVVATYVLHSRESGIYKSVSVSQDLEQFIYRQVMYVNPGDKIEIFNGANKALGIVFLRFNSVAQMENILQEIDKAIRIEIRES